MSYIENPKTKGSGVICAIPQSTKCPINCPECFFSQGRSYLEPLDKNLPNMPDFLVAHDDRVVRINDGNDSNIDREKVISDTSHYKMAFFNTSIPKDLESFPRPVVLTLNPGDMTDKAIHIVDPIPKNLMFVRVRTNAWNLDLVEQACLHYSDIGTPVVLTFMAYHNIESIPEAHRDNYVLRKRTMNEYYAITTDAWHDIMGIWEDELQVYSCGKIEGERGKTSCRYCGNCLREFFATNERMKGG